MKTLRPVMLAIMCVAQLSIIALPTDCYAKGSLSQKEIDAIVLKYQNDYADTFNRRDAKGMGALLTTDATMQNEWGDVTQGRDKIEAGVTKLMAKLPEGVKLKDKSLCSQLVANNVIVSQGISHRVQKDGTFQEMFFTRVLVQKDGKWQMAATQIARPSSVPKPTATPPKPTAAPVAK